MASMKTSPMAPFPTETLIYQQNGHRDDISYSDRLSTAMIYKAIGMLSSLETIVHHMGADSAASALASLLSELQVLCIPAKHQQHAAMFPGVPAATQTAVPHAATAEPDAPPAPAATAESDALKAVPRCTTCTDGVPVAGRFILRKVSANS